MAKIVIVIVPAIYSHKVVRKIVAGRRDTQVCTKYLFSVVFLFFIYDGSFEEVPVVLKIRQIICMPDIQML